MPHISPAFLLNPTLVVPKMAESPPIAKCSITGARTTLKCPLSFVPFADKQTYITAWKNNKTYYKCVQMKGPFSELKFRPIGPNEDARQLPLLSAGEIKQYPEHEHRGIPEYCCKHTLEEGQTVVDLLKTLYTDGALVVDSSLFVQVCSVVFKQTKPIFVFGDNLTSKLSCISSNKALKQLVLVNPRVIEITKKLNYNSQWILGPDVLGNYFGMTSEGILRTSLDDWYRIIKEELVKVGKSIVATSDDQDTVSLAELLISYADLGELDQSNWKIVNCYEEVWKNLSPGERSAITALGAVVPSSSK